MLIIVASMGATALTDVARLDDYTTLELLIESGADVNNAELYRRTALVITSGRNIACVKLLLRAGAAVNATSVWNNASEICLLNGRRNNNYRELLTLLFAAGESIREPVYGEVRFGGYGQGFHRIDVPKFLTELMEPDLCLSDMCRNRIRKHLMKLSNVNLFFRVPKLGLPDALQSFLLYDMSVASEPRDTVY